MQDLLSRLDAVLEARKSAAPDSSYVAGLYAKGLNKILKKVAEEAGETLIAAKDASPGDANDVVYETADLWFHTLVMLHHLGLSSADVLQELDRRFDLSGLVEKVSRQE